MGDCGAAENGMMEMAPKFGIHVSGVGCNELRLFDVNNTGTTKPRRWEELRTLDTAEFLGKKSSIAFNIVVMANSIHLLELMDVKLVVMMIIPTIYMR